MTNKSILEVFGNKSQDGDKVRGLLLKALIRNNYQEGGEVEDRIDLGNLISTAESSSTGTWQESNITPPTGQLPSERDAMQDLHTVLGLSGMIPGIGNVADLVDASIYGLEGKGGEAALSLTSALPIAGLLAGGIKTVKGGAKAIKGVTKAASKADVAKEAERMGMAQDVVGRFGEDVSDPKLVRKVHDTMLEASEKIVAQNKKWDSKFARLTEGGIPRDDALALMAHIEQQSMNKADIIFDRRKWGDFEFAADRGEELLMFDEEIRNLAQKLGLFD